MITSNCLRNVISLIVQLSALSGKEHNKHPGLEIINFFILSCSIQLSMQYIMLINVKMPTTVGILTFISIINTTFGSLKVRKVFIFQHFIFSKQLKIKAVFLFKAMFSEKNYVLPAPN